MSTFDPDEEERLIEEFDWTSHHEYSDRQEAREQDQYLNWYECSKEPSLEERTFKVDVSWSMIATVEVTARTLEEAMEKVRNQDGLPDDSEYLGDSFEVNEESTRASNETDA